MDFSGTAPRFDRTGPNRGAANPRFSLKSPGLIDELSTLNSTFEDAAGLRAPTAKPHG